jgi:penicillin-binding protein 2
LVEQLPKPSRGWILTGGLIAAIVLIVAKLVYLQVFQYSYYFQMSEENRIRVLPRPAMRGKIVDREGRLLASDRPAYTVSIIPSEVSKLGYLASELAPLLEMDEQAIVRKVADRRTRKYEPVAIRRDLSFPSVCIIEESSELFPGVIYQLDQTRTYYFGNTLCHLIGYTGEVDEREAKEDQYRIGSIIGRAGVERQYDQALRGIDGIDYLEVSATGRIIGPLDDRPSKDPILGDELALTLDIDLQMVIDSCFGDTLSGGAVFLDPKTGEILAIVSKPDYDANLFTGFVSRTDYQTLANDPRQPLFDRTIRGAYPPGSTAKLLTAGAALEEGLITTDTHFGGCRGGMQFGNRFFRCWEKRGHGSLDLYGAIEQSCDVYFYQLGLKLGLDKWSKYAKACGFNQPTGLDIPAEKTGFVPDENWYEKTYGKYNWNKSVMLNLAIGQGEFLATPMGLAQFYAGIANHGVVMKPHLMRYLRSPKGETNYYHAEIARALPFSEETLEILKEGCFRVVQSGTAARSRIPEVTMGGKTGTAQNPHGEDHAWFVGFAPVVDPQILGCVIVENAGHGSTISAPFVKAVFTRFFQKKGIIKPPPPPPMPPLMAAQNGYKGNAN